MYLFFTLKLIWSFSCFETDVSNKRARSSPKGVISNLLNTGLFSDIVNYHSGANIYGKSFHFRPFLVLKNVKISQKLQLSKNVISYTYSRQKFYVNNEEILKIFKCCVFLNVKLYLFWNFATAFSDIYFMSVNSVENS